MLQELRADVVALRHVLKSYLFIDLIIRESLVNEKSKEERPLSCENIQNT
jgi:hypothetical protein